MLTIEFLREKLKNEVFTEEDLKSALAGRTDAAILSAVSRALKSEDIIRIKRGVYVFGEKLRRHPVSKFSIANKIYIPSYVSLESALSFYGLIPEAVYVTTSACRQRKKKKFNTPLGDFSYDYIPNSNFFMGVESLKIGNISVLIANPIKAIFDVLYVYRNTYNSLDEVESDLRLNLDELQKYLTKFSFRELEVLAQSYRRKNVQIFLMQLARTMK